MRRRRGYRELDREEAVLDSPTTVVQSEESELLANPELDDAKPAPEGWEALTWSFTASGVMTVRMTLF